jgi:hypothetical protein
MPMTYRAIYAYAWDLAERRVGEVIDEVTGLGLNTITLAGSYHAGKFLRPRGKRGKVCFPEDGTVYFKADPKRYGRIKPAENGLLAEHDFFADLTKAGGIDVNAWMVLLHNSRLGQAFPDATVQNAFGDRYVYSLCPSNPDARDYAVALCKDIADRYPILGISVEAPGFAPYAHGFHHEFALVKQNRWLDANLGLCFCEHCLKGAEAAGIDVEALRARVVGDIESYLASDFDLPDDMAEALWLADTRSEGALGAFLAWRCTVVTSLVAEIRAAVRADAAVAVIPSVARPTGGAWYEGSDLKALAEAAGIIEACFYEPSAVRVLADAWDVKRRIGANGGIRGIMRAAHPDLNSAGEVAAAVAGLHAAGIDDIAFYNYGFYRPRSFEWIRAALAGTGG